MDTIDDFLAIVHDALDLTLTADQQLYQTGVWNSIQVLLLLTAVEQTTGRRVSLADALKAPTLADIYAMVAS